MTLTTTAGNSKTKSVSSDLSELRGIELRFYANAEEEKRAWKWDNTKPSHIRPDSTCVIAIGNNWSPGAWQKTVDMVLHTNKQGVCCWLYEMTDTFAKLPYSNVNAMRDFGCLYANNAGFEWVLILENDALPEKDMLMRLLDRQTPVLVPWIWDEVKEASVANPAYNRNMGLKPIHWAAFTCILMSCRMLNTFPDCAPFQDIAGEIGFYNRLGHFGHTAFQDTDVELKIAVPPTYHGALGSLKALWEFWEKTDEKRRLKPDRRPIDPKDPNQVSGVYMPPTLAKSISGKLKQNLKEKGK